MTTKLTHAEYHHLLLIVGYPKQRKMKQEPYKDSGMAIKYGGQN
jgi:hypothetical protein